MEVTGNTYTMRYKAAGKSVDYQMRIMLESFPMRDLISQVTQSQLSSIQLLVNLFDGGENPILSYRIDDGESIKMTREYRRDPFTYRNNPDPVFDTRSTRIWTTKLSTDLAAGVHTIKIEAIDEYGQKHTDYKIFELLDDGL